LDLFVDPDKIIATRLEELNGKRGGENNSRPTPKPASEIRMPVTDGMSRRQQAEMKRPISSSGNKPNQSQGREPTYHPMGMGQSTQKMNIPNMLEGDEE
jgi:hypothetical protein